MNQQNSRNAKILQANRMLQSKVGTGEIDPAKVEQAQQYLDSVEVDFAPMAELYMASLREAIDRCKVEGGDRSSLLEDVTEPVMMIKGNAAMFNYRLVGNLANIVLNFLETVDGIDDDVVEILEAQYSSLNTIINAKMSGDGGAMGPEIERELKEACRRYFVKHADELGES